MAGPTAFYAPTVRVLARDAVGNLGIPLNAAPNTDYLGTGIQDHRLPYNLVNSPTGACTLAWYGQDPVLTINQVPSTAATNNIATAAAPVSGTAMTLVAATGAGITVLSSTVTAQPYPGLITPTNTILTAGWVIDSVPALVRFGTGGTVTSAFFDRTTSISRAVSITATNGGAAGGNFTVRGYDMYGYAMSELITHAGGATTKNGKKAFKIVTSVTPAFSDAQTYSVGTTDIIGLPIRADYYGDIIVHWNNVVVTASTGFVAADTTNPATTTTGDVRGTYALQVASNNALRLMIRISPTLSALLTNPTTGLFGISQV